MHNINVRMRMKIPNFAALTLSLAILHGCAGSPRVDNTRLGSDDLIAMTNAMVTSLLKDDDLQNRTPKSTPWVISMDRVINKTNHVQPARENWAFMARLRAQLSQSPALKQRNLTFVLPVTQSRKFRLRGGESHGVRSLPTHGLAATFHSITNQTRSARSDGYLCEFQLRNLSNDQVIWIDKYEVKRGVIRNKLD